MSANLDMQRATRKATQRLVSCDGLIDVSAYDDLRPVFPRRDRRLRPAFFIGATVFEDLQRAGALQRITKGFVLERHVVRRVKAGDAPVQADMATRTIYSPDGEKTSVQINTRSTAFERLVRMRERGDRVFSAAEIEAGRKLAKDAYLAGHARISTQDFQSAGADGGNRAGAAERHMLATIHARTMFTTARAAMGPDFAPAVIAICCNGESLEAIERAENWMRGSGRQLIKIGLGKLVTLYGTEPGVAPRT